AAIMTSPFWAPEIAPLLPWSKSAVPMPDSAALATRLQAIERRPTPSAIDVEAIRSAQNALGRRVDQVEAARNADRQDDAAVSSIGARLQQLEQQLGTIEKTSSSRAASQAIEIGSVQQELTRLGTIAADSASRLAALEQRRTQKETSQTEAILLTLLLQIREAVEQA